MITLDDFKKIELRVARIIDVRELPGADRIWHLNIEIGSEAREIVAGVKKHYTREDLLGKHIVVIQNLEPAVIRGVASHGMLLAAKSGDDLVLLTPDRPIASGATVG
jgi:methionine--tRNA ligase beta chain